MVMLLTTLLLGAASGACGFAALGVALYADSPAQLAAAALFAGVGSGAGLLCGALHVVFDRLLVPRPAALSPQAPADGAPPQAKRAAERAPAPAAGLDIGGLAASRIGG